ncbi:hypothetical protein BpHYR1_026364 [Brachionus plicatilis]|uniref:HTH CENPB-type domain-containing protein n=1 Tax=Brachionus plicatilis TaxID=10195 RepID=A0A3M7T2Q8_BRAPC|nr:hypothetical protein BpHYR1_026364 [Brachionus plicatilis]
MLDHLDFKVSNGWLSNFKQRNVITTKTVNGEAGLVDQTSVQQYTIQQSKTVMQKFKSNEIQINSSFTKQPPITDFFHKN